MDETIRTRMGMPMAANDIRVFLESLIETHRRKNILRLPTVRRIALDAGVSTAAVCRELRRLKAAQVLEASNRRGILIRSDSRDAAAPETPLPQPACRCDDIAARLTADIAGRFFPPASVLPSVKSLCVRYGAGYAAVRQALDLLCERRLVSRHLKTFRVYEHPSRHTASRLVVIALTDEMSVVSRYTSRAAEFWRCLEMSCMRLNIRFQLCSLAGFLKESGKITAGPAPVLGFLVISHPMDEAGLARLVVRLAETGLPVSVIDETESIEAPEAMRKNPLFRRVTISTDETPGADVGRFLVSLGHRRIAVFPMNEQAPWCVNRVNGLVRVFEEYGLLDAVKRFSIMDIDGFSDLTSIDRGKEPFRTMLRSFSDVHNYFGGSGSLESSPMAGPVNSYLFDQYVAMKLRPRFAQALEDGGITAWVPVTDATALAALEFLRSQGVSVPQEISVAGFDDTVEAIGNGLTSYDFNVPAAVDLLLDHILRPPRTAHPAKGRQWTVSAPGMVMARASCAAPPPAPADCRSPMLARTPGRRTSSPGPTTWARREPR